MTTSYCKAAFAKALSQVKYSQLEFESDSDYETFIQGFLIPAAAKIIDGFCLHNFQNNSATITVEGNDRRRLIIQPPYVPILSISEVLLDGEDITASVEAFPTYLVYNSGYFSTNTQQTKNITVTLTYGYVTVPSDVQMVCAELVANKLTDMVRRKLLPDLYSMAVAQGGGGNVSSPSTSMMLTETMKKTLKPYRYMKIDLT